LKLSEAELFVSCSKINLTWGFCRTYMFMIKERRMMIEVVSPKHPDKVADCIAGALVDYCYGVAERPQCAFEILIGHGKCYIIGETSVAIPRRFLEKTVKRICETDVEIFYSENAQDYILNANQDQLKAGDNGIFANGDFPNLAKDLARKLFESFPYDGKLIVSGIGNSKNIVRVDDQARTSDTCDREFTKSRIADSPNETKAADNSITLDSNSCNPDTQDPITLSRNIIDTKAPSIRPASKDDKPEIVICWSKTKASEIQRVVDDYFREADFKPRVEINPLGDWEGGINVDSGATNRKLASDFHGLVHPIGGGGLHGKDLSKADVSVHIWCYLLSKSLTTSDLQAHSNHLITAECAIGDDVVTAYFNQPNGEARVLIKLPFTEVVELAQNFITKLGGFEAFAQWGFL
jgi:hypothetical protein